MNKTKEHWSVAEEDIRCNLGNDALECGQPAVMSCALGNKGVHVLHYCNTHWRMVLGRKSAEDQRDAFIEEHGYPPGMAVMDMIFKIGTRERRFRKIRKTKGGEVFIRRLQLEVKKSLDWLKNWLRKHEPIQESHFATLIMLQEEFRDDFEGPTEIYLSWEVGFELALETACLVDKNS